MQLPPTPSLLPIPMTLAVLIASWLKWLCITLNRLPNQLTARKAARSAVTPQANGLEEETLTRIRTQFENCLPTGHETRRINTVDEK